jgi:hypothetical protein
MLNVRYRDQKSPSLYLILNNPTNKLGPYSYNIHFTIIFQFAVIRLNFVGILFLYLMRATALHN